MGSRWIGTLAMAAGLMLASPAFAGEMDKTTDVKQAEQYAEQAYDAYSSKDYSGAVTLYLKALELVPSADVLYNVAKIYDTKLKDRELAMTFYRKYISDPGADPERVRTANERLAALRDAEAAANEPAPPSGGPSSAAPTSTTAPPPKDEGLSGVQITGLVMSGVGIVGLGLGTGFGLSAMSSADDANALCEGNNCTTQEGVDAAESASSAATVSTAGFTIGAALIASGTLLLLFGGQSSEAAGDSTALSVTPAVGPDSAALGFSGRW